MSDFKSQGNDFYKKMQFDKAIECYSKALQQTPQDTSLLTNRAACFMQKKEYKKALEDSQNALKIDPSFMKGYLRAGQALLFLGKIEEAKAEYNRGLAIKSDDQSIHAEMKKINDIEYYITNGNQDIALNKNYKNAKTQYELALQIAPQSVFIKLLVGEALIGMGSLDEAAAIANEVLKEDNSNSEAHYIRGRCLYYTGETAAGMNHIQKALAFDPDHPHAQNFRKNIKLAEKKKDEGNKCFENNDVDGAIKAYTEAINADPANKKTNAALYCNRAAALMKQGHFEKAEDDASEAIKLDPQYLKAYLRRGTCSMKQEKYEDAVRDFSKASDLDKSNEEIKQKLAEAQQMLKKSAKKDYFSILGLEKGATDEEIKKAYKKMAIKWHPDKHSQDEKSRKIAESKFKDIAEAYSILSDPKKRQRYEQGWDPNDQTGGMGGDFDPSSIFQMFFGGGGSPFGGGFGGSPFGFGGEDANPFGGSGFSFGGSPFGGGPGSRGGRGGSQRGQPGQNPFVFRFG